MVKPRRRRQNVCLYHKLLPNKLRQGDLNVAVFELKHDNPGLRQRSRGYVHPEEGVGGGWEGSMTTSVDAWERDLLGTRSLLDRRLYAPRSGRRTNQRLG